MTMNAKPDIPDWKLERYLLEELDEAEMRRIRAAVEIDASLRARLEALQQSNLDIHQKYPPASMSERIREKLGQTAATGAAHAGQTAIAATRAAAARTGRSWRIPRIVLVPAAALAVVAFSIFVLPDLLPTGEQPHTEVTRIKGPGSQLHLFRKTAGGSQQLDDGESAAAGDLILLQYRSDENAWGAIVSVDGRGTITTHLPANGNEAAPFEPGRAHLMDYAYELDDAPRWEVFFFVTSASAFQVQTVIKALEAAPIMDTPAEAIDEDLVRSLDLPDRFRISTFTLMKRESGHEN
jgi:hypothetical protein